MSKSVKVYAKLNIALNVLGVKEGYHDLDSVVTTVNKYNVIKASKRKDDKILVSFIGKYGFIPERQEETNAYKSALLFKDTFKTKGANIEITVNIPNCSGMGGSSVDIVGVLGVLKKLYKVDGSLKPLADSLGSDSGYLLKGGFARLKSRGEVVEYFESKINPYFVVIYSNTGVNTKDCFKLFDESGNNGVVSDVDGLVKGLIDGDVNCLDGNVKNALFSPAISLNGEVLKNSNALKELSPRWESMSGSGATVFAVYENFEMASWAVDKLKKQGYRAELLETYDYKRANYFDLLFDKLVYED